MKQTKFSLLENKYYYGISRVFWHFIIALGVLAIIAGLFMLAWSFVPPSKTNVVKAPKPNKEAYPSSSAVTFNEVLKMLPKKKEELKKAANDISNTEELPQKSSNSNSQSLIVRDTANIYLYTKEINKLKTLIPVAKNKVFWNGSGDYIYNSPIAKRKFKINKDESLRKWVSSSLNFEDEFIKNTNNRNVKSYKEKAELLASFNSIITLIDKDERVFIYKNYLRNYLRVTDLNTIKKRLKSISKVLNILPSKDRKNGLKKLKYFADYNKRDGIAMHNFQAAIISKFDPNQRLNIVNTINKSYHNIYNDQIAAIKENTEQFLPMVSKFNSDQQPLALLNFYKLFKNKNKSRAKEIQRIDANYQNKLRQIETNYQNDLLAAEANFISKKSSKKQLKWTSLKGMLGGLGIILLISLILLILSMIRNVNRLAEAMIQKNKN